MRICTGVCYGNRQFMFPPECAIVVEDERELALNVNVRGARAVISVFAHRPDHPVFSFSTQSSELFHMPFLTWVATEVEDDPR